MNERDHKETERRFFEEPTVAKEDRDAISRLWVRGLLTDTERRNAMLRWSKMHRIELPPEAKRMLGLKATRNVLDE
jgi:hypothetical protein